MGARGGGAGGQAKAREASAAEEARAGRGAGSGARGGASLDWLVEMEREEDWAREDKYDAAAFGVFMGSTGFSRFQGGLREWDEWDDELGKGSWASTRVTRRPKGAAETCA